MQNDIKDFTEQLARVFGHAVEPSGPDRVVVIVNGRQRLEVVLGDEAATITTPLAEAHDGLPDTLHRWLASRNFPGGGLAGGMLIRPELSDRLSIVNTVPARAMSMADLASLAWNQAQAAMELDDQIAARVAAELADAGA